MAAATMTAAEAAQQMIDALTLVAVHELGRTDLTLHDRRGYEADKRLAACHAAILASGWTVASSTHGSVYYTRPGAEVVHRATGFTYAGPTERLRLSNHDVPMTGEREASGFTWAKHGYQIVTLYNSIEQCLQDIADIGEDFE